MMTPTQPILFETLFNHYCSLPHCRAIGLQKEPFDQDGWPKVSIPYRADLVGNTSNQSIHGGLITVLVDIVSAAAVAAHLNEYAFLATLDLRIDYMHAAQPNLPIYAKAECFRFAGQVAFTRAHCYQHNEDNLIALGTATFMRTPIPQNIQQLYSLTPPANNNPTP